MLASFPKVPKTFKIVRKPSKLTLSITPLSFDASSLMNPREYLHELYIARSYSHRATSLTLIVWVYLHSHFRGGLWKRMYFETVRNGRSWSSKVIDFGTNRKHVCNFMLVIINNLGPILPRFRDIACFLPRRVTSSLFHPNFGVFSLD